MNINHKQKQLIDEMYNKVKLKYPQIQYKHLEVSPDDKDNIWIIVNADVDDELENEMSEYSAEIEYNILMDYGYSITMMYENSNAIYN